MKDISRLSLMDLIAVVKKAGPVFDARYAAHRQSSGRYVVFVSGSEIAVEAGSYCGMGIRRDDANIEVCNAKGEEVVQHHGNSDQEDSRQFDKIKEIYFFLERKMKDQNEALLEEVRRNLRASPQHF